MQSSMIILLDNIPLLKRCHPRPLVCSCGPDLACSDSDAVGWVATNETKSVRVKGDYRRGVK